MADLTDIEMLALSRLLNARSNQVRAARDRVTPGEHEIDLRVHVRGTLSIGEDYTQNIVAKADPWILLAVALDKLNGVTLECLVRESEAIAKARVVEVRKGTMDAMTTIKGRTKTPCRGKVLSSLVATPVDGKPVVSDTTTAVPPTKPMLVATRKPRKSRREQISATQVALFGCSV